SVRTFGENDMFTADLSDPTFEVPMPDEFGGGKGYVRRPTDLSWAELQQRRVDIHDEIRQAYEKAEHPDLDPRYTPEQVERATAAFKQFPGLKERERNNLEVEVQLRPALAV